MKPTSAEQPQQEPVPFAFYDPASRRLRHNFQFSLTVEPTTAWQGEVPLYLHPPRQEQPRRKPLTDEERRDLVRESGLQAQEDEFRRRFS